MAWPPATLPTNRTNATPQTNTHPTDHNTIGQAINDIVTRIQTKGYVDGGFAETAIRAQPAGGVVITYVVPAVNQPTRVFVTGLISVASDSSPVNGIYANVFPASFAGSTAGGRTNSPASGAYANVPVVYTYPVNANSDGGGVVTVSYSTGFTGTVYTAGYVYWQRFYQ